MAATQDVAPFSTDGSQFRSKILAVTLLAFAVLAAVALVGMLGGRTSPGQGSGRPSVSGDSLNPPAVVDMSRVDHRGYPEKLLP